MARLGIGASIVASLALAACAATNASPSDAPAPQTFSGSWPEVSTEVQSDTFSQDGLATLEARMEQYVSDGDTAGIATLLLEDGNVVSHFRTGVRREADGAPLEDDTIFRIYSMSKPITAVALLMLYEDGAFALDDPITKFVPEFENLTVHVEGGDPVPAPRAPTMAELMSHTAGLAYGLSDATAPDAQLRAAQALYQPDLDTFIGIVADTPLLMEPGDNWYYSVASDIKGAIIERISGQSFDTFLEERLFGPLGMDDTGFVVPEEDYDRFSDVWVWNPEVEDYVVMTAPWVAFREGMVGMKSGGGGMVSTLDDYARFAQMLLDGGALGEVRILQPETVDLLTANVLRDDQSIFTDGIMGREIGGMGFGLGVGTVDGPPATDRGYGPGTHYWGGAAGTWYWIDPENDLIFIGMIQRFRAGAPPVDFRQKSAELVYEAMVINE